MRGFIITNCPPPEINIRIVAAIQIATVIPNVLATSFILLFIHLCLQDKYTGIMPDKKMFQKSLPLYTPMILDLHHFLNLLSSGNFDMTDSSKRNTATIRISPSPQRMIMYFILINIHQSKKKITPYQTTQKIYPYWFSRGER